MTQDPVALMMLAIAGGLAGAVGWSVRQLPQSLFALVRRVATSTIEVRQPRLVALLDRVIFARSGQRRQQIDRMTPRGARAPGTGWHFFRHGGRWVAAHRDLDEGSGGGKSDSLAGLLKTPRLTLWCAGGIAPLDRLLDEAERLEREDELARDRSSYHTPRHGVWEKLDLYQSSGLESLVLPQGMAEDIAAAAHQFFGAESWYRSVGANWMQGWLFTGPPGTGKSRTAWAVAREVGAKLYTLDLGHPHLSNATVEQLIRYMDPRGVLLLDDLDKTLTMLGDQGQREGASQVTLAGILAALELPGAAGRLVIVTANDISALDPDGTGALLRPGRIDRRWEFGLATVGQTSRLLARFDGQLDETERQAWVDRYAGQSPATIYSELLRAYNPRNPNPTNGKETTT